MFVSVKIVVPKVPLPKFQSKLCDDVDQADSAIFHIPLNVLPIAVNERAPVPVAPEVGSPESCQTPFFEKYNFAFVISRAMPIISSAV